MELGATVCTPRRPRCAACPLRDPGPAAGPGGPWPGCAAARAGDPEAYPPPRRRRAVERHRRLVAVVEREGRLLLVRGPAAGELLAGIWELPWVAAPAGGGGMGDAAAALGERYGGRWRLGRALGRARHGITFRDLELHAFAATVDTAGELAEGAGEAAWHPRDALSALPLSSLVGKVLALVGEPAP
jgi:A/G-specific adenine glycosylase